MIILESILFGFLFGILIKNYEVIKQNKISLNRIEEFLFCEVLAKDEVENK
jgi:hypothetical protein